MALLDDGIYPLKPGGLRLYRRLQKIQQSIQKNNKPNPDKDLERLLKVLCIVDELKTRVRRISRLYKLIFEASKILGQIDVKAEKVQIDMQTYIDRLRNLRFRRIDEKAAVLNILKFTASYWEGLFFHYDQVEIPRTNNDLEVFNRSLKAAHRKTTGRVSCEGYIVRYGAYVALLDSSVCQRDTLVGFGLVSYGDFRRCFVEIRSFRFRISFKLSLTKDLVGFLRSLELCWAKTAV